jgi:ABC-2 type transport system ATP-binding protein
VSSDVANSIKSADTTVSFKGGRLVVDMPDSNDPNALLDAIRSGKGNVVSVIPRRKRLEDLFVETVRSGATDGGNL